MNYKFHDCKIKIQYFNKSFIFTMTLALLVRIYGYGLYQVPSESMETTMLIGESFFADKFSFLFFSPKHNDIIAFNDPHYKYSPNPIISWFQMQIYGPVNYTKRIIGCPGDEIHGVIEQGKPKIYIKKKGENSFSLLSELYLNKYPILAVCPKKSFTDRKFEYRSFDLHLNDCKNKNLYKLTTEEISNGIKKAKSLNQKPIISPETPTRFDNFEIKLNKDNYWVMGDNRLASSDSRNFGPIHKKFIHGKIKYRLLSFNANEEWWLLSLIKHPIDFWKNIRRDRCFQYVI